MIGLYGLCLVAALAAGCAAFRKMGDRAGLNKRVMPLLAVLAVVLGALCSRLYYHAANSLVYGMGFEGYQALSLYPYEYAMCGTLLGVLLAAVIAALAARQKVLAVLDVLAPAGLLALAVARFGEHFSDFGWGQVFENARWQFFPAAVMDMYEQWHIAVYMLEGVLALIVCAAALRVSRGMPGDRFLTALLWWAATQIFCESLRAETIRWGFVRVQQLQCAEFILCVLIAFTAKAKRRGNKKRILPAWAAFVLGIGTVVLMEYAIDKWDLSIAVCYVIMAAALAVMAALVQRVRPRLLPED